MTFIFYDTETTGIDTTFDQVLQFAAIKADDDLNILDTFSIRGRLLPHIVPSPGALLVTGVTIGDITTCPLSHYEMTSQIHCKMLEWSRGGAMFMGWNSMRFDEPLLRQTYYQSLYPVYQTNTNGNGRADAMRIAQAVSAAAPNTFKVPSQEQGKPSFKLGLVAAANGIVLDGAHEALADTAATLAVAKLIKQRVPAIWDTLIANGRKANVVQLFKKQPALLSAESYFGRSYSYAVAPITYNPVNDSEWGFFDLQFDPTLYLSADETKLRVAIEAKAIRRMPINAQPGLLPIDLAPETVQGGRLPIETYLSRAKAVREDAGFRERVARVLAAVHEEKYGDEPPSPYIEARIHEGFPTSDDTKRMDAFHRAGWSEREKIAKTIEDERYRKLGARVIAAGQPSALTDARRHKWAIWRHERLFETVDVPWLTVPKALEQIVSLEPTATPVQKTQLADLRTYLMDLSR
jgi:exodeoxyribonuclease-1